MAQSFSLPRMSTAGMAVSHPFLPSLACAPALGTPLLATLPLPSDALKLGPGPRWPEPLRCQALEAWFRTKHLWPGDWVPLPRIPTLRTVEGQSLGRGTPPPPSFCPGLGAETGFLCQLQPDPLFCVCGSQALHLTEPLLAPHLLKVSSTSPAPGDLASPWPIARIQQLHADKLPLPSSRTY